VSSNPTHWLSHECPHCDVLVYVSYEIAEEKPENIFCPTCGIKEEIVPLDFEDVGFGEDTDWDE
tara:strand:+ start:533 stop:724 length:192 start_codon:yes stop_codon:yes gene_type:complete